MKAYGGGEVQLHAFLNSVQTEVCGAASRPGRSTDGEIVPGTHCMSRLGRS